MTVELIRMVYCDICLKEDKAKVEATENVAVLSVLGSSTLIGLDGCAKHADPRRSEIEMYGHRIENEDVGRARSKPHGPRPGSTKPKVECLSCGRVLTKGAGWALHARTHEGGTPQYREL